MSQQIQIEREDSGICTLRFNRPERLNALTWQGMQDFAAAVESLEAEIAASAAIRVLILTGAGDKAFCSGGDQHDLEDDISLEAGRRLASTMGDALRRLEGLPVPSIAAVNGFALGGGSEVALACSLRVVDEALRFGLVHLKLGLIPGWGGGQRLIRLIGPGRAAEMMLSARPYGAREVEELGIANHVVPAGQAYSAARAMAERIAAEDAGGIAAILEILRVSRELDYTEALEAERALFPTRWASEAHAESLRRFMAGGKNA